MRIEIFSMSFFLFSKNENKYITEQISCGETVIPVNYAIINYYYFARIRIWQRRLYYY